MIFNPKAQRDSMLRPLPSSPSHPHLCQVCQGAACGERKLAQILADMKDYRVERCVARWTTGYRVARSPA
jgi:hypothetical protein